MGQKTNPISNRIGITRGWDSNWCGGKYAEKIAEDYKIRKYLVNRLAKASLSKIVIERTLKLITVTIHAEDSQAHHCDYSRSPSRCDHR